VTSGDATTVPVVSAITIFYNGARFLGEAIESVLAQTYDSWELLLVDDGSTDGSTELARGYAARHPDRIRYLEHPGHRNRGMSASRNLGLRQSQGALVSFLDSDDVWLPEKLARQRAILDAHPEAQITVGATRVWYGWTGKPADAARDTDRSIHATPDGLYHPPELLRQFLQGQALTPATCSVLARRQAFALTDGFEERFTGLYEDQAFFVKVYLKLPCYVTREAFDLYRQHGESHSADALRTGRYSLDRPSAALVDLYLWCARYFLRERVSDRALWRALLGQLKGIGLHRVGAALAVLGSGLRVLGSTATRVMDVVNVPAKRVYAAWYHFRHREPTDRP
jgi:glycosyltransferase involved in cell wall biosynthesis